MSDSLRNIILDFRETDLPTGVPRRIDVTPAPGKATVCIGPRRAGKSTFLFQQIQKPSSTTACVTCSTTASET